MKLSRRILDVIISVCVILGNAYCVAYLVESIIFNLQKVSEVNENGNIVISLTFSPDIEDIIRSIPCVVCILLGVAAAVISMIAVFKRNDILYVILLIIQILFCFSLVFPDTSLSEVMLYRCFLKLKLDGDLKIVFAIKYILPTLSSLLITVNTVCKKRTAS